MRGPAAVMGLYAIRPSYGAISMEGVLPAAKSVFRHWPLLLRLKSADTNPVPQTTRDMDTAGFTCRDAQLFYTMTQKWYGKSAITDEQVSLNSRKPASDC